MTTASPSAAAPPASPSPPATPAARSLRSRIASLYDQAGELLRVALARALLFALLGLALFSVQVHSLYVLKGRPGFASTVGNFPVHLVSWAVPTLCALPAILVICLKALVVRSINVRLRFTPPPGLEADPAAARAVAEAEKLWKHELAVVAQRGSRLAQHATLYGFCCTLALGTAIMLGAGRFFGGDEQTGHSFAAAALGAATVVAFVTDMGRMMVRSARRDASSQMFAWATKRFLLILTGTLLFVGLALVSKQHEDDLLNTEARWALLGAGVAVLGDRATAIAGDRVASALGLPKQQRRDDQDLRLLEGIDDEEAERLAEEAVEGIHALALHSTPRLFLHTPYPLHRICDWQDQALLRLRAGESRARQFRDQLGIRGASEAQRLARRYLGGQLAAEEKDDLAKLLGLSSAAQASAFMHSLADDDAAMMIATFRGAAPDPEPDPPPAPATPWVPPWRRAAPPEKAEKERA